MKHDGNRTQTLPSEKQGQALRRRAEEAARTKEALSPVGLQAASQEEMKEQLHELLVHQIELEMQNDELRRAQAELEEVRARYLDLYDLAPAGYCTLSEDGLILEANLSAASLLGVPRGSLIHQPITRFIHKENQDAYYLNKLQLFETGEPQSYELRMTGRDGTAFWANLAANIMKDADGGLKCRVVISDITERKLENEKLKEAEANILRQNKTLSAINQLHQKAVCCETLEQLGKICLEIIESATESKFSFIIEIKEDGLYSPFNVSAYGCKQDSSLKTHGLYESVLINGKSLLENHPSNQLGNIGIPEGHPKLTAFLGVPIFRDGKVTGMISVVNRKGGYRREDQEMLEALTPTVLEVLLRKRAEEAQRETETELRKTAEELERKDRLVTDFFINISHELKTPITLIMLALEIIENYLRQPEMDRTAIIKRTAIMRQNSNRLSRLVSNILDITKIDAGFMEPKLAEVDVVKFIHSLVESMESFAMKRQLQIEFTSSAETKRMPADSQIIERIILNLVSNAIKHTQEGGKILISFQDRESTIMISVKDNGEGIPDEKKAIIFDRFRQVNTSFTRTSEGSGVGLSLIKALVELLGGHIWFESVLGEGSEFFVELPVLQMEEKNQPVEQHGMTIDRRIEMEFSDIFYG